MCMLLRSSLAIAPILIGTVTWVGPLRAQAPDTVHFSPSVAHPTFAVREPVLTLQPGTVLVSETNWGGYFSPEGGAFPGEVGREGLHPLVRKEVPRRI